MRDPSPHTAEDAPLSGLRRASIRLLLHLAALSLIVVPLIRQLPLGHSTRTGLLAWLLVVLGFYWLYMGMGYRPLLLVQLLVFSTAAALLSAKLLLVALDVHTLTSLRYVARFLIQVGAACAGANLTGMLIKLYVDEARAREGPD
jgi:hypothetical protein